MIPTYTWFPGGTGTIPIVQVGVEGRTPEAVATQLKNRMLNTGSRCFTIIGFGWIHRPTGMTVRGDLFRNPGDAVNDPQGEQAWWCDEGIADWLPWTERFIAAYDGPDPQILAQDTEAPNLPNKHSCRVWEAMVKDPRINKYPQWKTLPKPANHAKGWSFSGNRAHTLAAVTEMIKAQDDAMEAALFGPLRKRWPGLQCSNWMTTQSGNQILWKGKELDWYRYPASTRSNHTCPIVYQLEDPQAHQDYFKLHDHWAALVNYAVTNIRQSRQCGKPCKPWLVAVGQFGRTEAQYHHLNKVAESEGCDGLLIWGDQSADWNKTTATP